MSNLPKFNFLETADEFVLKGVQPQCLIHESEEKGNKLHTYKLIITKLLLTCRVFHGSLLNDATPPTAEGVGAAAVLCLSVVLVLHELWYNVM